MSEIKIGPPSKRIVIEFNDVADADLEYLAMVEVSTKSTVVNRAVQVYRKVVDASEVIIDGERIRMR